MPENRIATGVKLMLAFAIFSQLLDLCSKLATTTIPVGEITMARFVGQLACMIPVALALRAPWRASIRDHWLMFWRAAFLVASTFCYVSGVAVMPIADALAIVFVMPFFLMFLGWAIFGNHVGPRRIAASLVGFMGALLVIQPSLAHWGLVALFPLGTAVFFSFYELITQALGPRVSPVTMQLHTSVWGTVITVPLIVAGHRFGWQDFDPVWPQGAAWLWLAGVGFWAAVSHLAMTFALKYAPVSTLAPLHYLEIVTAVILGLVVFGTFPNTLTLAGIAIISASGLYIIHREHLASRQGQPALRPAPPEAI